MWNWRGRVLVSFHSSYFEMQYFHSSDFLAAHKVWCWWGSVDGSRLITRRPVDRQSQQNISHCQIARFRQAWVGLGNNFAKISPCLTTLHWQAMPLRGSSDLELYNYLPKKVLYLLFYYYLVFTMLSSWMSKVLLQAVLFGQSSWV